MIGVIPLPATVGQAGRMLTCAPPKAPRMPVPSEKLQDLLLEVEKPVRYIGNEWNSIVREGPEIDVRVALAYPDQYEIGMSHLGFRILYSLLNAKPGVAAERVFAPWPDLEAALRKHACRSSRWRRSARLPSSTCSASRCSTR